MVTKIRARVRMGTSTHSTRATATLLARSPVVDFSGADQDSLEFLDSFLVSVLIFSLSLGVIEAGEGWPGVGLLRARLPSAGFPGVGLTVTGFLGTNVSGFDHIFPEVLTEVRHRL